jgi:16S rRNA (cytosine967-C5)-methyltransferase
MPFDLALSRGLGQLSDADRRLAHELVAGVSRHAAALDGLLAPFIRRGLGSVTPPLLDVLRIGAYQLRMLDRIPAHAAVGTSVALARERVGARVAGFTNAVLRRLATAPVPAAAIQGDDVGRLAARYSHPAWLVARWLARFGFAATEALLQWNNSRPPLIVQPVRGTMLDLEQALALARVRNVPAAYGAGVVVSGTPPSRLGCLADGECYVQDAAQALVVRFAQFPGGAAVYDACAAPGGKSLGLARGTALVIAADRSLRRAYRLAGNAARCRVPNVRAIAADALHPPIRPTDAVMLDAPCLGTGTFARHPDARNRVNEPALQRLTASQAALLDAAADRVVPGGVLCYATCSLEPEENEGQVTSFLRRHQEFERQPPAGFPREVLTAAGDMTTLPHRDGIDGAFAARLVRSA